MLYFNHLSYEMVQHKLNQELTNLNITLKKYLQACTNGSVNRTPMAQLVEHRAVMWEVARL